MNEVYCPNCSETRHTKRKSFNSILLCQSCSHLKHGDTNTKLYRIWSRLKSRYKKELMDSEWYNSYIKFREWCENNGYNDEKEMRLVKKNKKLIYYGPDNCIFKLTPPHFTRIR